MLRSAAVTKKLTIRASHRGGTLGRGVFATLPIQAGELLEESHVLVIPKAELPLLEPTVLDHYQFSWGDTFEDGAIAFSIMSLLNHDDTPNTRFERDQKNAILRFYSVRDIQTDEEITISYRTTFPDIPLWFDAR